MKNFTELKDILHFKNLNDDLVNYQELSTVTSNGITYPIIGMTIGSKKKDVPTFGIFAGVHGLERVGTHIAIVFLNNLTSRLKWDRELRSSFENFRIVTIPLINPAGMNEVRRSNHNGVDLMRNSPIESDHKTPMLLGGHTISPKLPWYRGNTNSMEVETQTVVDFVKEEMFNSPFSMSIDLHSGFGMKDRLWYPFAKSKELFPLSPEIKRMRELLDTSLPHHIYHIEQQSDSYTTNGDLWDYLFELNSNDPNKKGLFIPWTLELGSWLWVKKNPLQILSALGMFNPVKQHRFDRVMRRHLLLFDFMIQATKNNEAWV